MATYAKFNRPDPMRDWDWLRPHTFNLYEYVGNDPVNMWDPDGFMTATMALTLIQLVDWDKREADVTVVATGSNEPYWYFEYSYRANGNLIRSSLNSHYRLSSYNTNVSQIPTLYTDPYAAYTARNDILFSTRAKLTKEGLEFSKIIKRNPKPYLELRAKYAKELFKELGRTATTADVASAIIAAAGRTKPWVTGLSSTVIVLASAAALVQAGEGRYICYIQCPLWPKISCSI